MKRSQPLEFLAKAQEDPKVSARVFAALERSGKLSADEIMQIAHEFGFSFTRREFEKEVKRHFAVRFAAGDEGLEDMGETKGTEKRKKPKPKPVPKPPESSCAKGCLSYTVSWHPAEEFSND